MQNKIENQVLTAKQMLELEKSGLNIDDSSMFWVNYGIDDDYYLYSESTLPLEAKIVIPAFTLMDCLDIIITSISNNSTVKLYTLTINFNPLNNNLEIYYYNKIDNNTYLINNEGTDLLESIYYILISIVKHDHINNE